MDGKGPRFLAANGKEIIMKIRTLVLLAACLSQPALAGPPADKDNETMRMREKESGRALEAAKLFEDKEDFTEKYKHLKESDPGLFAAALEKRLLAAKAWQTAAAGLAKIDNYDQINVWKAPAYDAEEVAEIARMELRAAGAEREWKNALEKYKSREVEALAGQLIQNQRSIIQATKQRMLSQRQLRQLEIERSRLSNQLREMQDKAREEERNKRDKGSSRDRDKPQDRDRSKDCEKEKDSGQENRVKVLVE